MDKLMSYSQSVKESNEEMSENSVFAWMPPPRDAAPLDAAITLRYIDPPQKIFFYRIFKKLLDKKSFGSLIQSYLKYSSYVRSGVSGVWGGGLEAMRWFVRESRQINAKFLSPLFLSRDSSKWRPIIQQSCLSMYNIAENSVVKTNVLSVFPAKNLSYFSPDQVSFCFPEIFVTRVRQCKVYGGTNLILMENKVLCHDLYDFERDYTSEELHGRMVIDTKRNCVRWVLHDNHPVPIRTAASFVDACGLNYAHWLTEVLPRICLFCSDMRFEGLPIIVNDGLHPNLMDSLFLVVGANREIIILPVGRAMHVSRLYVMSPTGYIPFDRRPNSMRGNHPHGVFSPHALTLLRDRLIEKVSIEDGINFPKKIYLRRGSTVRKLINEDEIEKLLFQRGFSIIEVASLTIKQQIVLFNNADVIIGGTGAALANIIFSSPLANIAILMGIHNDMPYRYWMHMANAVGVQKVSYILGAVVGHKGRGFHGDYQIKITDILDYLLTLEVN